MSESGIQLLSPGSVYPVRPLRNGYQVTNLQTSLTLLAKWVKTCDEYHADTCQNFTVLKDVNTSVSIIQVIDVSTRALVEVRLTDAKYATLSWVWGRFDTAVSMLRDNLVAAEVDDGRKGTLYLPARGVPKLVEDAIRVCKALLIPYLWVDVYCIDQEYPENKASMIAAMGMIYHLAYITVVASGKVLSTDTEPALLPYSSPEHGDGDAQNQRVETISGRQYISTFDPVIENLPWSQRGWTYQEGQLARRIAQFGPGGLSFKCYSGEWNDSKHSGIYGHEARMPGVDLRSRGVHTHSAYRWLNSSQWDFEDYNDIVVAYARRVLTYDSDRLDAIQGCLNVLETSKKIKFFQGLPSTDFHYAMLFTGESDALRDGFPSWSWAGWRMVFPMNGIYPVNSKVQSKLDADGDFVFPGGYVADQELGGFFLRRSLESPHLWNRCSQWLACLSVCKSTSTVKIVSEVIKLSVYNSSDPSEDSNSTEDIHPELPDHEQDMDWNSPSIKLTASHKRRRRTTVTYDNVRLHYEDIVGNTYHSPRRGFEACVPSFLRRSTLSWLLRDGIELVKVVEVELLEGQSERLKPLRHVFSLGINRSDRHARRFGVFVMPKQHWDRARPREATVVFH
ncbi:uncharacterized protein JN550_012160 [Neoarthrinium moseri]|uniref:uncharacterized protein n=1 Tax=Neoarthrinium moseri TaxID=1658444 RepID=UPI001FDBB9A7|nr:uncharacterized protein JN550_012160 [Neoarthrinium moseri]KAI1859240.1 hypothetical protein JN550_012160 [Neoarthrinium moseri]